MFCISPDQNTDVHPLGDDTVSSENACCRVKISILFFDFWSLLKLEARLCFENQHSLGKQNKTKQNPTQPQYKTNQLLFDMRSPYPYLGTTFRAQNLTYLASITFFILGPAWSIHSYMVYRACGSWMGTKGTVMVNFIC